MEAVSYGVPLLSLSSSTRIKDRSLIEPCVFPNTVFIILYYNLMFAFSLDSKLPEDVDSDLFISQYTTLATTVLGTWQALNKCMLEGLTFCI